MIRWKFLYTILLATILSLQLCAQDRLPKDSRAIVYYHDGSVFVGDVIGDDGRYLQMVLSTFDTINVEIDAARRVLRATEDILIRRGGKYHYIKGTFATLQVGGGGNFDSSTSQIDLYVGRRLNKKLSVGMATGFHYYSFSFGGLWEDVQYFPIHLYGRYYLGHRNVRPFGFGSFGHGFAAPTAFSGDFKGALGGRLGFGVNFSSKKKLRYLLTVSQNFQHAEGDRFNQDLFNNDIRYNYNLWLTRIVFRFGIEFR